MSPSGAEQGGLYPLTPAPVKPMMAIVYTVTIHEKELAVTRMAVREAREHLAEVINRVVYGGERVVIERRGKDAVVVVSLEDVELLQAIEDRLDRDEILKAREEPGSVPWEQIKEELGL